MRAAPAALLLAACTVAQPPAPAPRSVFPAQGLDSETTPIEIAGANFAPAAVTDFNDGSATTLRTQFTVRLSPAAGGAGLDLGGVTLVSEREIDAVVPAGLSTGTYNLAVIAPDGRSGTLLDAFRVITSADTVAGFRFGPIDQQHVSVPFFVAITAIDAVGRTVEGYTGSVALSDSTGTAVPSTVGPFTLGRGNALVTMPVLTTGDVLVAKDGALSGASDPFDVVPGPPQAIAFTTAPLTLQAGSCSSKLAIETRDRFGNPSPVGAALEVLLQATPDGSAFFYSDSGCSTQIDRASIAAGTTGASFHIRGQSSGTNATVRAVPATLPSCSQTETVR